MNQVDAVTELVEWNRNEIHMNIRYPDVCLYRVFDLRGNDENTRRNKKLAFFNFFYAKLKCFEQYTLSGYAIVRHKECFRSFLRDELLVFVSNDEAKKTFLTLFDEYCVQPDSC